MNILAFDSSAKTASVAVTQDKKILCESIVNSGFTHSQTLAVLIDSCIKQANLTVGDIDLIAVNKGPGSFTGVRIGVALAKGLAFAKNIPVCGVSTLESLAYGFDDENCYILASLDARRDQTYSALFEAKNGKIKRLSPDCACAVNEIPYEKFSVKSKKIYFAGDGAQKCYDYILKNAADGKSDLPGTSRIIIPTGERKNPLGRGTAFAALNDGNFISAESLVPEYLRLSQAQQSLNSK